MVEKNQSFALPISKDITRNANDHDVLMCYQIFLGRNPETSFVIQEAKTHSLKNVINGFLQSQEFISEVYENIVSGKPLPHDVALFSPAQKHMEWLRECFFLARQPIDPASASVTWRDLFSNFITVSDDPEHSYAVEGKYAGDIAGEEKHLKSVEDVITAQELIQSKLNSIEHDILVIKTALTKLKSIDVIR